jgi:hypothetical protein
MRATCPRCGSDHSNPACPACMWRVADEIHLAHRANGDGPAPGCPRCSKPAPANRRAARRALYRRRCP